jgi:hypothetical protein
MPTEEPSSEEARRSLETRPAPEEREFESPPEDEVPFHIPRD